MVELGAWTRILVLNDVLLLFLMSLFFNELHLQTTDSNEKSGYTDLALTKTC